MNLPTKITFSRIIVVLLLYITLFILSVIPNVNFVIEGSGPIIHDVATGVDLNYGINIIYLITAIIFILGSATDWLDGYLARKNNQVTDLGKFLDPIADKMLVNSTLIFLAAAPLLTSADGSAVSAQQPLHWAIVILFILRDLVVDAVRFMAATKNSKVISANIYGKLKTVFQMVAIPVYLLNGFPFSYFDAGWPQGLRIMDWLMYIALFFSLLSGAIYLIKNKDAFLGSKNDK